MFKSNVGSVDRIIRIILGAALIAVYFLYPGMGWISLAALIVGIVALATGVLSTCLLYSILGISTKR